MFANFFIIIFAVTIIFSLFSLNVFADKPCAICGGSHPEIKNVVQKIAYDWYNTIYGGELFTKSENGSLGTYEILSFDTSNPDISTIWHGAETTYAALAVFGKMLVIIYVLLDIINKSVTDNFSPEHFVKNMIKMLIGIIVIDNGWEIVTFGMQFASGIFEKIAVPDTSPNGFNESNCIYYSIVKKNFMWAFTDMGTVFISWLILMVAKFIISIICWVRVIDIVVRAMFAPIGMSDIVQEGTKGNGFRYLKKLVASVLQGSIIVAIIKAYGIINSTILSGGTNLFLRICTMIILTFTIVVVAFKSSGISNDVVGA